MSLPILITLGVCVMSNAGPGRAGGPMSLPKPPTQRLATLGDYFFHLLVGSVPDGSRIQLLPTAHYPLFLWGSSRKVLAHRNRFPARNIIPLNSPL